MGNVIAMVLAGGRGKRMDIMCYGRPKPALPFAGKFRVIDFSLSNCIHSQISDVAVLTDYQRSQLANYLRGWYSANASFRNVAILEPQNGSYKGTADAIYQNLGYVERRGADTVLILAGDHIYKMDYRGLLAYHREVNADVTVGVVPVPIDQAHRFGTVATDGEGRIIEFIEKPSIPKSNLASMGIYVFNRESLVERLREDAARSDSPHDFGYAIVPGMVNRDKVFAYKFNGYWQDIGTIEVYYAANMELIRQKPSFSLDGTWPVFAEDNSLPSPRKSRQGTIDNSITSSGCMVKGHVENSILGPGVWVEEQAVVKNSVIMDNAFIGYHSVVDHCILDEGVSIGRFCYIGFGGSLFSQDWDITVLGKGVIVPNHTAIGCNCRISPHVNVADLATNAVPPGTIISPQSVARSIAMRGRVTANEECTKEC